MSTERIASQKIFFFYSKPGLQRETFFDILLPSSPLLQACQLGIDMNMQLSLVTKWQSPFRCSYAFYAKSIIFVHIKSQEDNAFLWFPLAFQV